MLKSTAMLLQEYSSYANPAAKIGRIVKKGELVPVVRGLYETDPTTPGYCLSGALYGSAQLSFEYALGRRGFIPEEVRVYTCAGYHVKSHKIPLYNKCSKNRLARQPQGGGRQCVQQMRQKAFPVF